jgi:hypothetical protein
MKKAFFLFIVTTLFAVTTGWTMNLGDLWTQIWNLEQQGEFSKTSTLISDYLRSEEGAALKASDKETLEYEIDRLYRIGRDYRKTPDEVYAQLTDDVKGMNQEEFQKLIDTRYLDWRNIDGNLRFFNAAKSNLFIRYPEYVARKITPMAPNHEVIAWNFYQKAKEAAKNSSSPYVLPQKYQMKMTITVKPDVVEDGKIIKCWMPFPREVASQKDIKFISSDPEVKVLAPGDAWMRSAYFEKQAKKGEPTVFTLNYEYTGYGRFLLIDPAKVKPYKTQSAEYKKWTQERPPHVVFDRMVKEVSKEIIGNEKNPYLKAKKIFDWIAYNTRYSYAHEYSTIPCIPDFVLTKRYGDCGQHGMTFIALCRYNGIPARWQSGWSLRPGEENLHDWTEFYLEGYGWVPCDPDMGVWVTSQNTELNEEQSKLLREYYCGNIDHYRLIVNNDHSQPLTPAKKSFRSDTVDFQRAELECDGKNLYFDTFNYDLQVTRL